MRVITSGSCKDSQVKATEYIAKQLAEHTAGGKTVLWLVSGGSAITVAVAVSKLLSIEALKQITLAQVDERLVQQGSEDENWQQLLTAGLKPGDFRRVVAILSSGNTLESAEINYGRQLEELFTHNDYAIGLFGIGGDGHTAGIKPTANPREFERFLGPKLCVGYQAADFGRVTITAKAMERLDSGAAYACGEDKRAVVTELNGRLPAHTQPAQLLKQIPTLVVFN